jgi:hypothetical protein
MIMTDKYIMYCLCVCTTLNKKTRAVKILSGLFFTVCITSCSQGFTIKILSGLSLSVSDPAVKVLPVKILSRLFFTVCITSCSHGFTSTDSLWTFLHCLYHILQSRFYQAGCDTDSEEKSRENLYW